MKLDRLIITQDSLRNPEQLGQMADIAKGGGIFDQQALTAHDPKHDRLIEIAAIEKVGMWSVNYPESTKLEPCYNYFVHNGHHRCVAIAFGGRDHLKESEYYVRKWKAGDYDVVNFDAGYVTPFDLYNEVRLADFAKYKEFASRLPNVIAQTISLTDPYWVANGALCAQEIIRNMKFVYSQPREKFWSEEHVYYLASKYGKVRRQGMFEFVKGYQVYWRAEELNDEYKLVKSLESAGANS